jgi:hypothetical protein
MLIGRTNRKRIFSLPSLNLCLTGHIEVNSALIPTTYQRCFNSSCYKRLGFFQKAVTSWEEEKEFSGQSSWYLAVGQGVDSTEERP